MSVRSTLRRIVLKVAITSISGPAENENARRLASERRINKVLPEEVNKDIEIKRLVDHTVSTRSFNVTPKYQINEVNQTKFSSHRVYACLLAS